ncbi:MAG: hybrid sensor histidine kinase/response regulator [Betaproteobacteria bacterium]|nr:MAG: hybrid sensor histidine kinase/response regulator [Betaproteobacteria bacterium]
MHRRAIAAHLQRNKSALALANAVSDARYTGAPTFMSSLACRAFVAAAGALPPVTAPTAEPSTSAEATQDPTRSSKKLRLRTLLTLPFVALVCVPALVIAGSSLYAGLKAVDVLSQQLIEDISSRVEQAAVHQLEEASITLQSAYPSQAHAFDGSIGTFTDRDQLERKLFELTSQTRTTSYLFYAGKDGSFVGVDRGRAGALAAATVRLQKQSGEPRKIYSSRVPLDRSRLIETEGRIYDAVNRPWYRGAEAERKLTWTPIYVSFASGALVTTASQPIITRDGTFHGVLAADVELSELSAFVKSVNVSANGIAFIIDETGYLVASSTTEAPFRTVDGEQKRVLASSSESDLVRTSSNWLMREIAKPRAHPHDSGEVRLAVLESSLGSVDVASRDITRIDGVNWRVVVAVPRTDFTASIVSSAVITFLVTLAALASSLLLGLWVLRRVTGDVEKLELATRLGADGMLPHQIPEMRLLETGKLADAFRLMIGKVQLALGTIRSQNEQLSNINTELEQRVVRRTQALNDRNDLLSREVALRLSVEQSLREASEQAVKTADAKAKFLAMLSHELRTPLQAIIGSSQMLTNRLPNAPKELATLDASAKSMFALVDGILSYSRLEAGRVALKPSRFKTTDLLDEALDVVTAAVGAPRQMFAVSIARNVPEALYADAGMIRQLLINLLHNAHKHGAGAPVSLSLSVAAAPPAQPADRPVTEKSQWLRFAIRDQGVGISDADQVTLFQPFSQIGVAGADPSRGSGLGLSICRMLATELGGIIELQSAAGAGSTFSFTIPVPLESALPSEMNTPSFLPTAAPLPKLQLLLVEDHAINRALVTQLLESLQQTVRSVATGEDAIDAVRGSTFDLVLLDVNLPGMSGLDVARALTAQVTPQAARPLLCALTASDLDEDRALARASGMEFFLPKPATLRALETLIREVAQRIGVAVDASPGPADTVRESVLLDTEFLAMLLAAERSSAAPFVGGLLLQYGQSVTSELTSLRALELPQDRDAIRALAHGMRGAAKSVGALGLAASLEAVERAPTPELIQALDAVAADTLGALDAWRVRNLSA